jgi:uncharacterized protein (TIGR01777 family)
MKQVVLITGANGMLAKHLAKQLEIEYSVRFLTRKKTRSNEYLWDLNNNYIDPNALIGVHNIIHLAGSSIANKRWTKKRKQIIISSRVDSAGLILKELKKHQISIETFISASAIGYYGTKTTDEIYNEKSPKGNDFLSDVCDKWEHAAYDFKSNGIANRIAIVRIGIILAGNDGVLKKIMQPIKYGLGSGIGTGNQYMPWIHIRDLVGIFKLFLDDKRITGTFNAVSPQHISNMEFTKAVAQLINRPLLLPNIPKFIIQGLYGEMSSILLEGSKISSEKILNTGFRFEYEKLRDALRSLIK